MIRVIEIAGMSVVVVFMLLAQLGAVLVMKVFPRIDLTVVTRGLFATIAKPAKVSFFAFIGLLGIPYILRI